MKALLPLFTLVVGIFLGGSFFAKSPIEKGSLVTLKSERSSAESGLRGKLKELHDVDIQEYLALKEQKAQFVKANDILSKMMMVFLADLGLRVGTSEIQKIKDLASGAVDEATQACNVAGEGSSIAKENKTSGISSKEIVAAKEAIAELNKWKENEKRLESISTDSEIKDFLKDVEIKNVFDVVASSKIINKKQFENLSGTFEGIVVFDDKNSRNIEINLELDANYQNGVVVGKSKIVMSRNGEVFSDSNGQGDIKDFKTSDGSKAIIVATGGRSDYLQVYFVRGGTTLVGNYYKQESMTKFSKAGTITLNKL